MQPEKLSGQERELKESEIISTRTDHRGVITFINPMFTKVTGFTKEDAIGKPHNLIRHPDVPRCVYKLLWDEIKQGNKFFAVTKNRCKNGDHYWTLGYFQAETNKDGEITGFRSTRHGLHDPKLKKDFDQLYKQVREEELQYPRPQQIDAGMELLYKLLKKRGFDQYEAFAKQAL
ncbi:MAG TPA: PAS domain-containing protein [Halothiobacillaceae bacterium]|nr:PAS domain-containing protein [Halothiobacillaceae bacterium]